MISLLLLIACTGKDGLSNPQCTDGFLQFQESDLTTVGRNRYTPYHNEGPNVAAFDWDQDGDIEIFQCFIDDPLLVYDGTAISTVINKCGAMGVIDWNQDGLLDLIIEDQVNELKRSSKLLWLENTGGALQLSHKSHLGPDQIHNIRIADLDGDDLPDIYLAILGESENQTDRNRILFSSENYEVSDYLDEAFNSRKTFDSVIADFNNDGWFDVMDANDRGGEFGGNVLWVNDQGNFEAEDSCNCLPRQDSMGIDVADINRDGWFDVVSGDAKQTYLLINDGTGGFIDVSQAWGAAQMDDYEMSWGVRLLDVNNDGGVDIVSAQGDHTYPGLSEPEYEGPLELSVLQQTPDGFVERAQDWGWTALGSFRSVLPLHWNDDGVLDYWITDVEEPPTLLVSNGCSEGNWLHFLGPNGTMVKVTQGEIQWTGMIHGQSSYGVNRSPHWHVGLGGIQTIDRIEIRLPNQDWILWNESVPTNQHLTVP